MSSPLSSYKSANTFPGKVRWGYGASGYAASIFFLNFVYYAMYFFTDIVGIAPAVAGAIVSVGALWDAVTDPIVGYLSDIRDPKKGRRRPFLLWMAVPLTVSTFLSFFNPGLSPNGNIIFFILVVIACYTFQTMVDIPYTALGAEMTTDYDERSKLNACRNVFWVVGMILSCAFLFFVDVFAGMNQGDMSKGFAWTSLLCASPIIFCLIITYCATKGYELSEVPKRTEKFSWSYRITEPLKNKPFRYVTGLFAMSIIAQTVNNAVGLYWMLNNLGLTTVNASYLFVFSAVMGFGQSWIVSKLSQRLSKRATWNICMGSWAFSALVLTMFVMKAGSPIWLLGIFVITMGMGLNTQYQMALSMIPDCIEVDEFKTGTRREGMYYGITSLVQKAGAAITMAVCGFILGAIGYDGMAEVQSAGTLKGLTMMFGLGLGVFLVISIVINLLNPMSRKRHKALVEAIEQKKAGKAFSTEGFEMLL